MIAREEPNTQWQRRICAFLLCCYIVVVLSFTVFTRSIGIYSAQTKLLWSYQRWIAGGWNFGREILKNIALFIPFGIFIATILPKYRIIVSLIFGVLLSSTIEILQLVLMRGLFELDDILSNTLGSAIGCSIFLLGTKIGIPQKKCYPAVFIIGIASSIALSYLLLTIPKANDSARNFCFQVDEVRIEDDIVIIDGFALLYQNSLANGELSLELRSTVTGEKINCEIQRRFQREDVEEYFQLKNDYSLSGFEAVADTDNLDEEYECYINWGWRFSIPTGVFITGNDIHYYPKDSFVSPETEETDLSEVVSNGYLRVYRSDQLCWVYQYDGYLFWIADEGFCFNKNDNTYIQFQLWTTQPERLPKKRIENGWEWDNKGSYFEDYEITNEINCGKYRVCKRALPTEYSITAILTGIYKGKWIWKDIFCPYYEFSSVE